MLADPVAVNPAAGRPAGPADLIDVPRLITAYFTESPDPSVPEQRVLFGTSGHRGSALEKTFNEAHILAISEAICRHRERMGIDGPLFLGADTHALSAPACASALEVLAAHGVHVMLAEGDEYTPTPAVSHAILTYNRGRRSAFADGIVVTPSHNPPEDGGFKYNAVNGGPAETQVTTWIETQANELLASGLLGVKRVPLESALRAPTTHRHDYIGAYVDDLAAVIDMEALRKSGLRMGVDPLGGAGVHYWARIAEHYGLDLTVVDESVDPTFRFMTLDRDGRIRMDPSSPYAMRRLIALKDRFDIAFGCDTDHDRHGIVTAEAGLLPPNHYLSVCVAYLFRARPGWRSSAAVGKTVVTSRMLDKVAAAVGRPVREVPVGFKWFVDGLFQGNLGFAGEESAGASFLRKDGRAWTTDKDGIVAALLAAEITATRGRDPSIAYGELTAQFGDPVYARIEGHATQAQKRLLSRLDANAVDVQALAGERVRSVSTRAPGNDAPIGGVKVSSENGWFAARPSGTEDIYRIYAESFLGRDHLGRLLVEAEQIVAKVLGGGA